MYGDITNVDCEIHYYTCNNWGHRNSNKSFKEKFGSLTMKTFDRFTAKGSYTWNITRNTVSNASENWSLIGGDRRFCRGYVQGRKGWRQKTNNNNNSLCIYCSSEHLQSIIVNQTHKKCTQDMQFTYYVTPKTWWIFASWALVVHTL
jgi:hypothetical protein